MNPRFLGIVREEHKAPVNRLRPVEAPVDSPHESSSIETPAKEALPRLDSMCSDSGGSKYRARVKKETGSSAPSRDLVFKEYEEKKTTGHTGGSTGLQLLEEEKDESPLEPVLESKREANEEEIKQESK